MAALSVVYPPNRPMERPLIPTKTPVSYDYLFFLDVNDKGELIVGSSNVTGPLWESILYHYKDVAAATTELHSGYYIGTTTTADAKFIKNDKVVLAEDSGCLKLLSIAEIGDPYITCEEVFKTTARIEQLSSWNNSDKILACADTTVIVGDMQSGCTNPLEEYKNYHTELVTSVDTNKHQDNLFASASIDRKACIWDSRMKIIATVLYENEFSGLTSISWNPTQSECIIVGTEGGVIYSLDVRQPKEFLNYHNCFNTKIHRTVFNNSGYIGVCGDTSDVLILNYNDDFNVVHKNNDHLSFVRGLAWYKDTLYSCGFDKKITKHVY